VLEPEVPVVAAVVPLLVPLVPLVPLLLLVPLVPVVESSPPLLLELPSDADASSLSEPDEESPLLELEALAEAVVGRDAPKESEFSDSSPQETSPDTTARERSEAQTHRAEKVHMHRNVVHYRSARPAIDARR